jgi:TolA-binding protein
LQLALKDRGTEISARYAADTEKARIDAMAKVEAERVKAASAQMLQPLERQIDALKQQINMLRKEEQMERKVLRSEMAKDSDSDAGEEE